MIPVTLRPEPPDFDVAVRQKGLSALQELVGKPPTIKRTGRVRAKVANNIEDINPDILPPFWQDCLDDLHREYNGICAYVCVYIDPITGARSADHFIAKSRRADLAYEWSNYRLASSRMNARKNDVDAVIDPFEVEENWFHLDLFSGQLFANPALDLVLQERITHTIERLGLSDSECCRVRLSFFDDYREGQISFNYVQRKCPIVACEIRRQSQLRLEDR